MYKFSINSSELTAILSVVSKVILSKNTMPILDNVLFAQDGDDFTITGSSNENELTRTVPSLMVTEGTFAPFCVDASQLLSILSQLPEQALFVTVNDNGHRATFNYSNGRFEIPYFDTDAFPRRRPFATDDIKAAFSVPTTEFLSALSGAVTCVVKENMLRPVMASVAIDAKQDGYVVVGTDGHMLYKESFNPGTPFLTAGEPQTILIPQPIVRTIQSAFGRSETISITYDGRCAHFTSPDTSLYVTTVEGRYPNYNSVIPENQSYHFNVSTRELIATLRRVQLFASSQSNLVRLVVGKDNTVSLKANDIDFGCGASETLQCKEVSAPEGYQIGFNSVMFLSLLSTVACPDIIIKMSEPDRPITMREDDPKSSLVLLNMPLLLDE